MERAIVRGRRLDERTAQDDEVDVERAVGCSPLKLSLLNSSFPNPNYLNQIRLI